MPKILKIKDKTDNYHKKHKLFDLPFKLLINSKSQIGLGKTTLIINLLLNPEFGYDKIFKGENIYIVSNNSLDQKLKMLAEYKEIPEQNIMEFNENDLKHLYTEIEEEVEQELNDKNVQQRLIIFDDCVGGGQMKKVSSIMTKLVTQGRHLMLSQIYTCQRFSLLSTIIRSNITGAVLGSTSMKELELIAEDYNYLKSKREFINLFRENTNDADGRGFLVINFSNPDGLYMDRNFKTIKMLK